METNPQPVSGKKTIFINAASASMQILVTGAVYFFLYNYLIGKLGPEQLGIWSLVLATSSIANVAGFGISTALVKFVAEYKITGRQSEIQSLVVTSLLSIFVFYFLLISLLYLAGQFVLSYVLDSGNLAMALDLLPYSLLCLWINAMGGIFTSVLDGYQKNYVRNIIMAISGLIFLGGTYWLLPSMGLLGVAYAQVAQALFVLLLAFIFCFRYIAVSASNWRWSGKIFRSIISYGYQFQIVTICQMLYEPTTKLLLGKFGDLSLLGYYEMASRLVWQVRGVIINANQVMIPVVTEAAFAGKEALVRVYRNSFTMTVIISTSVIAAMVFFSPLLSIVWIGHDERSFVSFVFILSVSMLINLFSGPAYFGYMGEGKLKPLIWAHIAMGIINAGIGLLLGSIGSAYGVAAGWGIAVTLGSGGLIIAYHKEHQFDIFSVFNRSNLAILLSGALFMAFYIFYIFANFCFSCYGVMLTAGVQIIMFSLIFIPVLYSNAFIKALLGRFQFKA